MNTKNLKRLQTRRNTDVLNEARFDKVIKNVFCDSCYELCQRPFDFLTAGLMKFHRCNCRRPLRAEVYNLSQDRPAITRKYLVPS